ncbi:hypothetical protein PoB_005264400 [Plakobranchus ocellatus]|uniref:G-protein coupled receptors family 1 profile domain-containing protein n=1 Tax=Plakobranchus ocellatus TaxID=259542 RepID=A0AAV4C4U6_9GAST|nr:hypothetical protein PoB_005264400 [Plakobranchus ocellatus]
MVLCMTGIFFLCELFPALSFILTTGLNKFNQCSMSCNRFAALADTMVILNAAINFAIYCAAGKKFRDVFWQVFCVEPASGGSHATHSSQDSRNYAQANKKHARSSNSNKCSSDTVASNRVPPSQELRGRNKRVFDFSAKSKCCVFCRCCVGSQPETTGCCQDEEVILQLRRRVADTNE